MKKSNLWLLFLIPLALTIIKTTFALNSSLAELQSDFIRNIAGESRIFYFGLNTLIKLSPIPLMILTITAYEIIFSKKKTNLKLSLSLARINNSEGEKFADIWYFFINILFNEFPLLVTLLTFGISNFSQSLNEPLQKLFNNFYQFLLPNLETGIKGLILIIIVILIEDLISYTKHRLEHKISFLWDFHEFHHSATQMTILSRYRGLPIDGLFTSTLFLPVSVFTGLLLSSTLSSGLYLPLITYAFYVSYRYIVDLLGHSSNIIIYPKPISNLFMSPSLHLLHHSAEKEHFDKNFGQFLTIWDLFFGTYLDETNLKKIKEFGVKDTQYNKYHPLYTVSILPLIKISKRIKNVSHLLSN